MIHALHGNAGLPEDLHGILTGISRPFRSWHLWQCLDGDPACATLEGFASMLNEAAARDSDGPRVLLGYSLGGRLALHALTEKPDNWQAAILVSPHPGLQNAGERPARLQQDKVWATRFLNDPWDQVMSAWNSQTVLSGTTIPRPKLEEFRVQVAQAFDGWSLGRQQDLRPLLPSVKCPVLWITGEEDEKFTALASACTLFPNGIHRTISNAGHRVHLDQPAAVISTVQAFLDAAGI